MEKNAAASAATALFLVTRGRVSLEDGVSNVSIHKALQHHDREPITFVKN